MRTATLQMNVINIVHRYLNLLFFAALLLSAGQALSQGHGDLKIATGGTGGLYYPVGVGLSGLLSRYTSLGRPAVEVTSGPIHNLQLIGSGKNYIGFTTADAALDALSGIDKFRSNSIPLRTLAVMYPWRMHVVTIEGSGISGFGDIHGKSVSIGDAGSATALMATRLMEAGGVAPSRSERLSVVESARALKDGKIAAFFWLGGVPTAAIDNLASTPGVKIKLLDHAHLVPILNKKYGNIYVEDVMAAGSYRGLFQDAKHASIMNLLVANETIDDQVAYEIVKTMLENRDEFVRVHAVLVDYRSDIQRERYSSVPFHQGATRYLAEFGLSNGAVQGSSGSLRGLIPGGVGEQAPVAPAAPSPQKPNLTGVDFGVKPAMAGQNAIEDAKKKCVDLGFKPATEKFGQCVLQLSK